MSKSIQLQDLKKIEASELKNKVAFPVMECPGCHKPLRIISTELIAGERNITTYHCDKCGMQTERIFRADNKTAGRRSSATR